MSLYAKERGSHKIQDLYRFRLGGRNDGDRKELINLSTYKPIYFPKAAFTLAEVLITLGIIGVVAAMTIPNLITTHQKQVTVTKLQKAISIWKNAHRLSREELGEPTLKELQTLSAKDMWLQYYSPYVVGSVCENYKKCGYKSVQPWSNLDGSTNSTYFNNRVNIGIRTNDGFFYFWQMIGGNNEVNHQGIFIDLNGVLPPNTIGKDVFLMKTYNGELQPVCFDESDIYVNNSCMKGGVGVCCLEKIRRAGWKIDNSYPWK